MTNTPELMIERVPCTALLEDPANCRLHGGRNLEAIQASLLRFGQQKPIVVRADNVVVAGNGTLRAARALGWEHVDIVRSELNGAEAIAYAIADNRSAELAEWDEAALAQTLAALQSDGSIDELVTGFNEREILNFINQAAGLGDGVEDEVPDPPDEAVTHPGDLWVLGDHRLLCADASQLEDVDRLINGAAIHLVHTDPPYNVKVEPRSNNAIAAGLSSFTAPERNHHQQMDLALHPEKGKATHRKLRPRDRPLANDFVSDEQFDRLLQAWFGNMARVLVPGRGFYLWGGYANCANYPPVLKATGLYFSQAIIWVKEHPVLTRKDFMGNHEWCFYGWREGAAHVYLGPNNAVDVWSVKKINPQSMIHLTEKPVELAVRAMQYSSRPGENVLDLFGGSGSTLIAAEQTGRKAYLMELDPLYCDVIADRYQRFTGRPAILERTGASPIAMKAREERV